MANDYIWSEVQYFSDLKAHFVQERNYPALIGEITGRDVNDNIRVNLKTRFSYLLDATKKTNEYADTAITMHDWELDIFLHLCAHLDMLSGYNSNNEMMDRIRHGIESELYGSEISKIFEALDSREQDVILRNFCSNRNGLLASFKNAFKELYPEGLIYRKGDTIYVYLDRNQSLEDDKKIELLKKLFVPIHMNLKVHYKYHMGIIGIEETMKIGKIRIV